MSLTPALAYLRVSGLAQVKGDGFDRQREAIAKYAREHGIKIAREYAEMGVSGTIENMDRPAWAQMIADVMASEDRLILVERLDRLARQLITQEAAIADLHRHGITLISVSEPDIMTADPSRVLIRQIIGALAQYEKSNIVAKMKAAKVRMRAAGNRCEGRKPYGHDDPEEAEILAWMSECKQAGQSSEAIARALNDLGRVTRYGKPWIGATVQKIVRRKSPVPAQ